LSQLLEEKAGTYLNTLNDAPMHYTFILLTEISIFRHRPLLVPKIELNDAKAATDKVIRGWAKMELPSIELKAKGSVSTERTDYEKAVTEDPISYIRDVANTDSNLSLVAFRIEVEKRLRQIAERNKLASHQTSLSRLIRNLENKAILPSDVASGLMDLVALGNRAAHGVKVSDDAAAWVLDVGSSILLELDNLLKD
jgi:hypothetical protein